MKYTVNTDGGSRGNPGPAAIGVVLKDQNQNITELSKFLGNTTNNVAEYTAVLYALEYLQNLEKNGTCETEVAFILDSELVVKQLTGLYKIKEPSLLIIANQIKKTSLAFKHVSYQHVKREFNKHADKLVNRELDQSV
jgi:ribonuclease HI